MLSYGQSVVRSLLFLTLFGNVNALASERNELYSKPIPIKEHSLGYHAVAVDTDNPASKELLVKLSDYGVAGEEFYSRKDGLNAPYYRCVCGESSVLKSRESVAKKLKRVNERLAALGLELFVFDAYRPVSCQRELWKYFIADARRILGNDESETALENYASRFCSRPTEYNDHQTGGAIDLTIRRKAGELLYMGSIFDEDSELCFTAHFESQNNASQPSSSSENKHQQIAPVSNIEAMRNRRLLYWMMIAEGFLNYRHEWWHFDYGDQPWVQNNGEKSDRKALYDLI